MFKRISIGIIAATLLNTLTLSAQRISIPSDGRFNFNIRNDVRGLDFITRLKPVTYQFDIKKFERKILRTDAAYAILKSGEEKICSVRRSGFIAQDVELAATESGYNFSGISRPSEKRELYTLHYESMVVPVVKAIQEQQDIITSQQLQIAEQEKRIKALEQDITAMNEKMNALMEIMEKTGH